MITGAQLRMARAALRLSIKEVARQAKVSPMAVIRLEANLAGRKSTITAVRELLEKSGIIFTNENDGSGIHLSLAVECVQDLYAVMKHSGKADISG
jgi:transcriptional regulator with XRE-family HTH domain